MRSVRSTWWCAVALAACSSGGGGGGSKDSKDGGAGDGGVPTTGLGISSAAARSCEIRFRADPQAQVQVDFADAVRGSWRRREDRVAIAVATKEDAAFAAGSFAIGGVADLTPELLRCYDGAGVAIDGVELTRN